MLSICQLHLQLPVDDCPTAATVGQSSCVCVCAITVSLLTIMIRESCVAYSFP